MSKHLGLVAVDEIDGQYMVRRKLHGSELRATGSTVEEAREQLRGLVDLFESLYAHVVKEVEDFDQLVRDDVEFIKLVVRDFVFSYLKGVNTRSLSKELNQIRVLDPEKLDIDLSHVVEKLYKLKKRKEHAR